MVQCVPSLNAARDLNPDVGDILFVPLHPDPHYLPGGGTVCGPLHGSMPSAPLGFTQRGTAGGQTMEKGKVTVLILSFLLAGHAGWLHPPQDQIYSRWFGHFSLHQPPSGPGSEPLSTVDHTGLGKIPCGFPWALPDSL